MSGVIGNFPKTEWPEIGIAGNPLHEHWFHCLSAFCEAYEKPLLEFLVRTGIPEDRARDDLQDFFLHLVQKNYLGKAREEKGRLRNFLLTALRRHCSKRRRKEDAERRGGGVEHCSIDDEDGPVTCDTLPSTGLTPEQAYEAVWAREVALRALGRVAADYKRRGKQKDFVTLVRCVMRSEEAPSYREIGEQLGITAETVAVRVSRLRARYRGCLKREIARTIGSNDPDDVEEELRFLERFGL